MIKDEVLGNLKILVNSPKHWDPLHKYLNELLGVEFNRLVYADNYESIKEIQGNIRTLRRIIALPEEVRARDKH